LFEKFGVVKPLLVTPNGMIVDGEARWQVLRANGASYIDVIVIAAHSPAEAKARLALNRIGEDAKWDDLNVRIAREDIAAERIDLDLTGFNAPEIDHYLNLDVPQANVEENGSDIPPVGVGAVSAPGIIWGLVDHRVGCGSATDLAFVSRVLNGRAANDCFVDAPNNIKVDGLITGEGRRRHHGLIRGAGELSTNEYFALLRDSLLVLKRNCTPAALVYSCIGWRHVMELTVTGHACDMPLYTICVCCGVERDYLDVAIRRWQNATGRDSVLTETGEPFNDVDLRLLAAPSEPNDGT
jgi:hypothetical protein